jgi:hypothetical protein
VISTSTCSALLLSSLWYHASLVYFFFEVCPLLGSKVFVLVVTTFFAI